MRYNREATVSKGVGNTMKHLRWRPTSEQGATPLVLFLCAIVGLSLAACSPFSNLHTFSFQRPGGSQCAEVVSPAEVDQALDLANLRPTIVPSQLDTRVQCGEP